MKEELHQALNAVVPHVSEGSQIFVLDDGAYHRFRIKRGEIAHTGTHSSTHVESGRGPLSPSAGGGDLSRE